MGRRSLKEVFNTGFAKTAPDESMFGIIEGDLNNQIR
jgi:hypothetical protein